MYSPIRTRLDHIENKKLINSESEPERQRIPTKTGIEETNFIILEQNEKILQNTPSEDTTTMQEEGYIALPTVIYDEYKVYRSLKDLNIRKDNSENSEPLLVNDKSEIKIYARQIVPLRIKKDNTLIN